jgi:hypothetical protein
LPDPYSELPGMPCPLASVHRPVGWADWIGLPHGLPAMHATMEPRTPCLSQQSGSVPSGANHPIEHGQPIHRIALGQSPHNYMDSICFIHIFSRQTLARDDPTWQPCPESSPTSELNTRRHKPTPPRQRNPGIGMCIILLHRLSCQPPTHHMNTADPTQPFLP